MCDWEFNFFIRNIMRILKSLKSKLTHERNRQSKWKEIPFEF